MVSGVTKLRTGVVLIADEVSLQRLGSTTALAATWQRVRELTLVDECLIVTDSDAVRRIAEAWQVRCLRWQDVGPVAWAQSSDVAAAARPSAWPQGTVASAPVASAAPLKGTELAFWPGSLRVNASENAGLWAGSRWDVMVLVDVACVLWDTADLRSVVETCERHSRAFLAAEGAPTWVTTRERVVSEVELPACSELSTLHAYRLTGVPEADPQPVIVPRFKGWSLRDPVERLGIEAVWLRSQAQERASRLPAHVAAVVMDFDGVLTDNRVAVDQHGTESVSCHRGDGLGLESLRRTGVRLLVISKERNPVVRARCDKLQVQCLHGVDDKLSALRTWAGEHDFAASELVYVGNDVNDLECLEWAGCAVAVQDSHPEVLRVAHIVLDHEGGKGAVRELCEMILLRQGVQMPVTTQ